MHKEPRVVLSELELKDALEECAKEPIHIPGSIQPHGFLVIFDPATTVIENCSANVDDFLSMPSADVLGKTLEQVFGADTARTILSATTKEGLEPLESSAVRIGSMLYDAVASRSGEKTLVEFEPQPPGSSYSADKFYYEGLRYFAIKVREAQSSRDLYDLLVQEVFALTGIDRVKLYKFGPDWNGEVVAEAKREHMSSYLGLHFPASDIPEQARRLYMKNYLRIIPDIRYRPSPIVPTLGADGQAIDLSQSVLRSVSPVHIQYLDNMNVKASMSISIIQNGRLWGLVACHHNGPLYVPYRIRMIAEIVGHIFSAQLSSMEEIEKTTDTQKRKLLIERLTRVIHEDSDIDKIFARVAPLAIEALNASSLAFRTKGKTFVFGAAPGAAELDAFFEWLKDQRIDHLVHADRMPEEFQQMPALAGLEGGYLATRVTVVDGDFAVWFKHGISREVRWAGSPEKSAEMTKAGYRLTPRSSFALWNESVKGRAEAWTREDLETAGNIVKILLEGKQVVADQANLAKSEFLANLSHELRTPMNAIIGISHLLSASNPLSDRQRMFVGTLKSSADNLLTLINDLLDVAKIEAKSIELEEITFDLRRMLHEIVSMMSVRAMEKGIRLNLDLQKLSHYLYYGDPNRLRQVMLNLISNAVKFTDSGDVTIRLQNSSEGDGMKKVTFEVMDTGIGIASDKLHNIFDKFAQADASITRRFGGTGLGLSITKTLVELMGGFIAVKSEPDVGSTFFFTIPLKISSPVETNAEKESAPLPKPGAAGVTAAVPKVLVVEDFEANAMVAGGFIEDFGYSYDLARNGQEALKQVVEKNSYFAILMDVQMPGMNGFDATRAIRRFEEESGAPRHYIIGMTAHALLGDRERCYEAGMDDYMAKPFSPKELKSKLIAAIFTSRAQNRTPVQD
ncbi:MAG TPA: ATP-binding protein [Pseudomonadales bacterium]